MSNQPVNVQYKAVWGASTLPFADSTRALFESESHQGALQQLKQFLDMRASGVICGPHGTGKSILLDALLDQLPEKSYQAIKLSHSSVTGSDMLRAVVRQFGLEPSMRRSDNVHVLMKYWDSLGSIHPVILVDEAQELESRALEELRLLCCDRSRLTGRSKTDCFSLVLTGDEDLLPTLKMGVHRALRSRLGFCLQTRAFTADETRKYIIFRWQQAGVHNCPCDDQAITLMHHAASGVARGLNQLGGLAATLAATQQTATITQEHMQAALKQLPWLCADPMPS